MLNGTTGEISTASEYTTLPTKDRQGNDVPASVQPLKANSILKFKVGLKDTDASAAPVTLTPTALQFAGYPEVTGVKAEEPKSEDVKKDNSSIPAPSQPSEPAPDAKSDAKTDVKADAKADMKADMKADAKVDAKADMKADAKTEGKSDSRDGVNPSKDNPSKDGVKADSSSSSQAHRESGSSKGALANTGATGVAGLLVVGSIALLGGAAILVRRRKA